MEEIFNDEEWRQLKRLSGLTDQYRTEIGDVVRFLREKPSLKHPFTAESQEARANIRRTADSLTSALSTVKALIKSGAHFVYESLEVGPDNVIRVVRECGLQPPHLA